MNDFWCGIDLILSVVSRGAHELLSASLWLVSCDGGIRYLVHLRNKIP
jgi:hypothetical protein